MDDQEILRRVAEKYGPLVAVLPKQEDGPEFKNMMWEFRGLPGRRKPSLWRAILDAPKHWRL